jgi:hypothetical protein
LPSPLLKVMSLTTSPTFSLVSLFLMALGPAGRGTKNDCAGKASNNLPETKVGQSRVLSRESAVPVGG